MRRIDAAVLAIGAAVLCLHALFPPRWNPEKKTAVSREFILSAGFYRAGEHWWRVTEGPLEGMQQGYYENVTLHYDRFLMLSVIISAATICAASLLRCLLGPRRQAPTRDDVPPTAAAR